MPAAPHPLPQLIPLRVEAALRRLSEALWLDARPVRVSAAEPTVEHRPLAAAKRSRLRPVREGEAWGRLYDQRWFRAEWDAPPVARGGAWYLEWRDQGEATLWLRGQPYYGFDVAHRRVALPAGARDAWIEGYCCQSAIWHPDATGLSLRGSVFGGASLVRRDDAVWNAVQDLQTLFDLLLLLRAQQTPTPPPNLPPVGQQFSPERAAPVYRQLLRALDRAVDALDTGGVAALAPRLRATLADMREARARTTAILTGHAHIDLVWLWPERMGEAKAVHTFSTINRLMEIYPEFRFAYSQPASYRAVERRAPALAAAVQARARTGRWQITGAMDVESDTLLPCGEALARSLLLGQADFRRLRGAPARLLWLPDVFGYTACLPQLMRLAGVEWFFTTKLAWSAVNRFPHSSFVWRGNDGSEVVAHVTQGVGYNSRVQLAEIDLHARCHAQADVHPEFLHPVGYGDGGGGPTEEMCERARRLGTLAGAPAVRWGQPEEFFARLARLRRQLPIHQGECYLEYHRGTYTTHGNLKAAFRGLERALQIREAVAVATGARPDLTATWRRLVFAQFHDYIPGSSVADVYAEGLPELNRLATTELAAAHAALDQGRGERRAFNPLAQPWRGWVQRSGANAPAWVELPPLASTALAHNAAPAPAHAESRTLRNDRVRATLGRDGSLRRLVVDGREIAFAGAAAQPWLYPDRPANFEVWDIDRQTLALGRPARGAVKISVAETGGARAVIAVERALGRASRLTTRFILEAGAAVLRLELEVDWREPETLLKLHFPTTYRGLNARFGAPFGSVLRGQQPGASSGEAQWEVPGSRWAAVAHDGEREGLALITEAKYGFSARNGELTVSLLRGARIPGYEGHRKAAPPALARTRPASPFSDQGRHVIRLALGAYDACGASAEHPAALADTLFTAPLVYRGAEITSGLLGLDGAPTLLPAWAAPADGRAWVLRLHEVSGQSGAAQLRLAPGWRARRCGLDGRPLGAVARGRVKFSPYQIVSVRLEPTA